MAAVRSVAIAPAPLPRYRWAFSCSWVSRIQCQRSMLLRALTRCNSASGVVRRLVRKQVCGLKRLAVAADGGAALGGLVFLDSPFR